MDTPLHPPPRPPAGDDWTPGREHERRWRRVFAPPGTSPGPAVVCTALGMRDRDQPAEPRVFDHHLLLVVLSGSGWFSWCGRDPVRVAAPVLLRLPPGVEHRYGPSGPGWSECYAGFRGPAVDAAAGLGRTDDFVVPLSSPEPACRVVRKLATVCNETEPHYDSSVAAGLHELLSALRRSRAESRFRPAPTPLERFADAACLPISVPEHAVRLALSRDELRDTVGRAAGCSPKEFILGTRLNHAKHLLAGTDLTVAAVARRVGYPDQGYFTRLFSRRVGVPPSAFRGRHAPRGR